MKFLRQSIKSYLIDIYTEFFVALTPLNNHYRPRNALKAMGTELRKLRVQATVLDRDAAGTLSEG